MRDQIISEILAIAKSSISKITEKYTDKNFYREILSFINEVENIDRLQHYKKINDNARKIVSEIQLGSKFNNVQEFLRLSILQSIVVNCESGKFDGLPQNVFRCQTDHLKRIASVFSIDDEWLNLDNDIFQKEMGITNLRLYVAGSQLVDIRCGIPRSIILKKGLLRMPTLLLKFIRTGGFKPFFQIHTHKFNLRKFNEDGWNECYLCCVELYELHPESLGMFGASWFYDPALNEISPRLSYLSNIPLLGGAFIIRFSQDDESKENAISTSETRKQLYLEGKYKPTSYMLVWPKSKQIQWIKKIK